MIADPKSGSGNPKSLIRTERSELGEAKSAIKYFGLSPVPENFDKTLIRFKFAIS